MNYIKRKLKTTSGLLTIVMGLSILVLGVSYATFVITTNKYKASEMLISNLTYGINITTAGGPETINGRVVTLKAGQVSNIYVKITSLNNINSNYSLEYKILSGSGSVSQCSWDGYASTGDINNTGTEKTVIVSLFATTDMSVEFNVSGGYTYNGTPSTLTGYTKITGVSRYISVTSTNTGMGTIGNAWQTVNNGGTTVVYIYPTSGYEYESNTCGGVVSGNIMTVYNITNNIECKVSFKKIRPTLYTQLIQDNPTILTRTDFSSAFSTQNTGTLYKASGNETEDGSNVYYFAGNALNNWVKFGKDQDNKDLYWRIIRTNEDGSVRLLYIGPDKATTSAFIKTDGILQNNIAYNLSYSNTMYVGYMYGSTGSLSNNRANTISSNIKQKTDLWYSKTLNIKTDTSGNIYNKYISRTAIYCNDRSGDGYLSNKQMEYAPKKRLVYEKKPSYKCGNDKNRNLFGDANVADKFSASTSKGGNGKLEYPIAQITADEIAYAGGKYGSEAQAWYYYNSNGGSAAGSVRWWTTSPYEHYGGCAEVIAVLGSSTPGDMEWTMTTVNIGIRPVLSLKSCVKVTSGNGSSTTPYEVIIDSTCASAEN